MFAAAKRFKQLYSELLKDDITKQRVIRLFDDHARSFTKHLFRSIFFSHRLLSFVTFKGMLTLSRSNYNAAYCSDDPDFNDPGSGKRFARFLALLRAITTKISM
jgi:hypothetical protein